MPIDSRALWRPALTSGVIVLVLVTALAGFPFSLDDWKGSVVIAVRCLLAGAVIPLIYIALAGRSPPDVKRLLVIGTAVLGALTVGSFPHLLHIFLLPFVTMGALASDRFHRRGVALMFISFFASVVVWLVTAWAGLYLSTSWQGGAASVTGLFAFGTLILAWTLRTPWSWKRWLIGVPVLVLGLIAVWDPPRSVTRMVNDRYLRRRDLNAFAARVDGSPRIQDLAEWGEGTDQLNGTIVTRTRAGVEAAKTGYDRNKAVLLSEVLTRDGIAPAVYEDVRKGMRRFHFRRFLRKGDYIVFVRGRNWGLVYAGRNARLLADGDTIPGTTWVAREPRGRWSFH